MAITDPLASVQQFRTRYPNTPAILDDQVTLELQMVSNHLRRLCGREFTKDASATTRVFVVPRSGRSLAIDEYVGPLTSVKIDQDNDGDFSDETALTGLEMRRDGAFNADEGAEPEPWNEIYLLDSATPTNVFLRGQRVQVETIFGWPSVPQALVSCAIEVAAIWLMVSRRAHATTEEAGRAIGLTPRARTMVDEVVAMYRRPLRPVVRW